MAIFAQADGVLSVKEAKTREVYGRSITSGYSIRANNPEGGWFEAGLPVKTDIPAVANDLAALVGDDVVIIGHLRTENVAGKAAEKKVWVTFLYAEQVVSGKDAAAL